MSDIKYYITKNNEDVVHYGVLGMKWGIRRNTRLLASHRRNKKVRKAKMDYFDEKIDNDTKKERIRQANTERKQTLRSTKEQVKNSSAKQIKETSEKLSKQVVDEVPNYKIKRGAAYVNEFMSKYQGAEYGVITAAGVVSANPTLTIAGATGLVGTAIGAVGRNWVLDNLS